MPSAPSYLFDPGEHASARARPSGSGRPRLRQAHRQQVEWMPLALDDLLPEEHPARLVWDYVGSLDLAPLYEPIRSVEGHAGHPPCDPKILVALWLWATLEGIGSARALARRCERDHAYRWLCGQVSVNYHSLADFRVGHGAFLDRLLTETVASLLAEGLVTLKRVAQDGMRVRASAGASSFRRQATLQRCLQEAQAQVQTLRAEVDADPQAASKRQAAARQRALRERQQRLVRARDHLEALQRQREKPSPPGQPEPPPPASSDASASSGSAAVAGRQKELRVSTTDAQARVMKMADGGFRPAYNVQVATATDTQIIVGVEVVTSSDAGQMAPMVQQLQTRYGRVPEELLVDGVFATKEDVTTVGAPEVGTAVYAPLRPPRNPQNDPYRRHGGDSDAVAAWRQRMQTEEAKEIYKQRAATAECVNALARQRGLQQFLVRGLAKVRAVALWYALAHNLRRLWSLRGVALAA